MADRSSSKQEPDFVWNDETVEKQEEPPKHPARLSVPPRRVLIAGAAAVVLAAGTFGIVDYADHGSSTNAAAGEIVPNNGISATFANPGTNSSVLNSSASASASGSPSASPTIPPSATKASATATSSHAAAAPTTKTAQGSNATTAAAAKTTATDLALGRSESSSTNNGSHVASNVIDGDTSTYWESQVDSSSPFYEWVQVDLEQVMTVSKIVMRLPPSWSARTQTIKIEGLATGYNAFVIKAATSYTFSPSTGNEVTITFSALSARYIQLIMTTNSAVNAGQMGDVEIYG